MCWGLDQSSQRLEFDEPMSSTSGPETGPMDPGTPLPSSEKRLVRGYISTEPTQLTVEPHHLSSPLNLCPSNIALGPDDDRVYTKEGRRSQKGRLVIHTHINSVIPVPVSNQTFLRNLESEDPVIHTDTDFVLQPNKKFIRLT